MKNTYLKGFNEAYEKLEADLKERYPQISSANYSVFKARFVQERHLDFSNEFCQGSRYKDVLPQFEALLFKDVKEVGLPSFEECYHISKSEIIVSYSQGENGKKLINDFFEHGDDHIVYDLGRMAAWSLFGMRSYAVCTWIDYVEESGEPVILQNKDGIVCLSPQYTSVPKCLIASKCGLIKPKKLGDICNNGTNFNQKDLGIYYCEGCEAIVKALYDYLIDEKYISNITWEQFFSHFNGEIPDVKINWGVDKYLLIRILDKLHPYLKHSCYCIKGEAISFSFEVAQQHFTVCNKEIGTKNSWEVARSNIKHEKVDFLNVKKMDNFIQSLEKIKKNSNNAKLQSAVL
ncbi:hypothetical protein LX69_03382 [Breznakibacter xylanolyticus]|uniref:Uncharacterized protein n=1 Tax=Breznakibacter xylanolyticus TaxID=990 RepID=A0A2W7MW48_9BACT|nr:hypothetical protein [Breznakibacter xylanolyticus]PZX10367.1 hypothetical protein LX69_03382 [Breznakibacter xylanolyticus]